MGRNLKMAIAGALALGSLATMPIEASAMPVAAVTQIGDNAGLEQSSAITQVYWRYGWRRPYWRGYGWRRPYAYVYGWHRPFYRYGWRRGFYRW